MTRGRWREHGAITAISVVCATVFVAHAVLRHADFHSPAYDLGFFDQLTYNLSVGRGWASSFIAYDFRGQHWEPILLVWAQLYRLVQSPVWLLVINALALALAPWAAWRLARRWLGPDHPGAIVAAVATALSPLILRTAGFDYHSEALTPLFALLALEAASRRRWLGVAVCCGVLVLLKEDAFLVASGVGWLAWRADGRRVGLLIAVAALAGFLAVVLTYMPPLRGGMPGDLLARYAYLDPTGHAKTVSSLVSAMIAHPSAWIHQLTSAPARAGLAVALLPLALLPLLSGWALLGALPPLAVALLSRDPFQGALQLHYGAEAFPLLLACALVGWRRLEAMAPLLARPPARRALGLVATGGLLVAAPLSADLGQRLGEMQGAERASAARGVLDRVPAGVPVAASTDLVPHLSERPWVTEFPDVGTASWVVIDELRLPSAQSIGAPYYGSAVAGLARHFHVVATAAGVTLWERS